MNTGHYVYALQAMRFWLNDMHKINYDRITADPDEEELMVHVAMCFDDLFAEYKKAYIPTSNMVPPDLLRWEAWDKFPDWPPELEAYFPEDKHAVEKVKAFFKLPFETIEPCLPIALTWLQDVNWPIAHAALGPLRELKGKLVPALKEALLKARQTSDYIWAYNLAQQLIEEFPAEDIRPLEDELCYLVNVEDDELGVTAIILLAKHKLWNKEMIQKWAKIKRDAYAEWVVELDKIIKE